MKKNPFLIGYLAVTAVGTAALGFLLYSGYSHYTEVQETYDSQVSKLISLKNRSPFPSDANNEAYSKLTADYKTAYEQLLEQVRSMEKPLEPITPSAFQDRLRAVVSEVADAAQKNNVVLPDGFYLGFNRYESELPSEEAAGPLARQLDAIRLVVDRLIESKVREIRGIRRDLLPEESKTAATSTQAPRTAGPGGRPTSRNAQPAESIVQSAPFDITFISDQGKFRQALNAIVRADLFLVIRALNITNSATTGPTREAPGGTNAETPAPTPNEEGNPGENGTPGEEPKTNALSNLRILVGQETLEVSAQIEMLTFTFADSSKK